LQLAADRPSKLKLKHLQLAADRPSKLKLKHLQLAADRPSKVSATIANFIERFLIASGCGLSKN